MNKLHNMLYKMYEHFLKLERVVGDVTAALPVGTGRAGAV